MTILSVCQAVAPVIGLRIPSAVMGSTEREHIEMAALANEMAERIAFDLNYDWSALKRIGTLVGNGVDEGFNFPSGYRRMLKKTRLWPSSSPYTTLTHYPDSDMWLGLEVQNFRQLTGGWTIIGTQLFIKPIVPMDQTVKFFFIMDQIVKKPDATPATSFMVDEDAFVLSERLLKLAMIWQWKANKGQPYAEDLANYEDALASIVGADRGSNIITVGRGRVGCGLGTSIAFPGTIIPGV